jgi:hypothetical protein
MGQPPPPLAPGLLLGAGPEGSQRKKERDRLAHGGNLGTFPPEGVSASTDLCLGPPGGKQKENKCSQIFMDEVGQSDSVFRNFPALAAGNRSHGNLRIAN